MSEAPKVCVVDYGGGNIQSVYNVFEGLGVEVILSNKDEYLAEATHIVLPGVGAFGVVMDKIKKSGLIPLLEKHVLKKKKPFLGICIGMQILAEKGLEYGEFEGLGWIPGVVDKMDPGDLILPHMGWNNLNIKNKGCNILKNITDNIDFYFVHSYYFNASEKDDICATFDYEESYTAVIQKDNIYGVQFHPEKSQKAGKILLENFLSIS